MVINLNEYQQDIFKEIGNVGIGTGATALSQMINREVKISFPHVQLVDVNEIFDNRGDYLVSNCQLEGDLNGLIAAIFKKKNAFQLIDLMFFNQIGTTNEITEDAKSAYNEMLNVIGGCYLNSLADMLNIKLMPKPPVFFSGSLVEIKDSMLKELSSVSNSFFVETEFIIDGEEIVGSIFLILDDESNNKILQIIDNIQNK